MPAGDWRFTWVDSSGSMQNPLVTRADPTKAAIAVGVVPDNKPTQANLGSGFIYDPTLREVRVDFTGYALTTSIPVNTSQLTNDSGFLVSSDLSGYAQTSTVTTLLAGKLDITTAATTYQPLDSDLTAIAALSTTAFGRNLLTLLDAAAGRAAFGLGTAATLNSTALATAAQGAKADTALQSINSSMVVSALGYTPYNGTTNPSGFLTGITGSQVTGALGYTPYNGTTNPLGFLTTITSSQIGIALGYTPYSASNPSGFVTQSGARSAISLTTTGSGAATYDSATGNFNIPTPPVAAARVFTPVATPPLNTATQLDASRDVLVSYSVDISVTSLLLAGTAGTVILEYGDNSSMTNAVTVTQAISSTGGVLNVTNVTTANLSGVIPAGKFRRIRTVNTTGTPTFTARASQEVKL